jgi:hypothetical protein
LGDGISPEIIGCCALPANMLVMTGKPGIANRSFLVKLDNRMPAKLAARAEPM